MRPITTLALMTIFLMASQGCGKIQNTDSKEAVQKAVEAYLLERQNLMMANMDVEVAEVKFEGDTATADVKFRSKQSSQMVVQIQYKLKKSDTGWQVVTSSPAQGANESPHGALPPSDMPPDHGGSDLDSSH